MATRPRTALGIETVERRTRVWARRRRIAIVAFVLVVIGLVARDEARASWGQARYFTRQAGRLTSEVGAGPSDRIRFPGDGPYDRRFGYSRLPAVLQSAASNGYRITAQARVSAGFAATVDRGVYPIFREKTQAGLRILDRDGATIFASPYPARVYSSVDAVPPAVWQTLLFLENRSLFDPRFPNRNPSVDWARMTQVGAAYARSWLGSSRSVPGASTLATQLEKLRHSTEGRTRSTREKLLQMEAASLRSYLGGENTEAARRAIVADYLNSVPLAAIAGYGEVTGLGDGLWAWYGADPDEVNRLLWQEVRGETNADPAAVAQRAVAYRQVLSLMLAHRRPSSLLLQRDGRDELRRLTNQHLRLVAREGIISTELRDAALAVELTLRNRAPDAPRIPFIERKAASAVRTELLTLTGVGSLYDLDRFDLTARTTLDLAAQAGVTTLLGRLADRAFVRAQGLASPGLLSRGDPAGITYAVVLYEHTPAGNAVRVQTDNVDGPFNVNEGSKLELGSTAKLRTLISYLEIVEQLYLEHAGRPAASLRAEPVADGDWITAWTLAYLAANPDAPLERTLEAAMSRPYSASPVEIFAGRGPHTFRNADTTEDREAPSVRDAFARSVNLPFVRILRDVVSYHTSRLPGGMYRLQRHRTEQVWDEVEANRQDSVTRLADDDRTWIEQWYGTYGDADSGSVWDAIARGRSAPQLGWVYRSVAPEGDLAGFTTFLRQHVGEAAPPSDARIVELYDGSDPVGFSLTDRGRFAGLPPLELWLAAYLRRNPRAPLQEVLDASDSVRRDGYVAPTPPGAIDPEAFRAIHRSWQRLGYPFGALVPSYATALGTSADRPDHLAELAGIVLNDGVRYPVRRVDELQFAVGTPYETRLRPSLARGERVLSSAIAAVVRAAMVGVVVHGTARRSDGVVRAADGSPLTIGAKTGTGSNRLRTIGRDGRVTEDRAIDRTATVVFFMGDRFFGTITAFVTGAAAGHYTFTSLLPVQILRMLGPTLQTLVAERPEPTEPNSP